MARELSAEALARLGALPDAWVAALLTIVQTPGLWRSRVDLEAEGHGVALIAMLTAEPAEARPVATWDGYGVDADGQVVGRPLVDPLVTLTPYGAWLCSVRPVEWTDECPNWGRVYADLDGKECDDEPTATRAARWPGRLPLEAAEVTETTAAAPGLVDAWCPIARKWVAVPPPDRGGPWTMPTYDERTGEETLTIRTLLGSWVYLDLIVGATRRREAKRRDRGRRAG